MGTNCSSSPKTIDCLYEITSHAGLVPDASLDTSLASFLSLNSSWSLEQQYSHLQREMTRQQRFAFNRDLHTLFGGNATVSYGGVGVVALALSVLFEMLAHHQTAGLRSPKERHPPPDPIRRMFGAGPGSDISSTASEMLKQIPSTSNEEVKMAALLERYERKLRTELMELYDRMLGSTALSSARVKRWMNGAALHIHTFLHWKRLTNSSAPEALSQDYLHQTEPLLSAYREYLLRTVKVFPALNPSSAGLLIVEPLRNVSHGVRHRACEREDIQRALVERFLSERHLETVKQFFQSSRLHHDALMAQQNNFHLQMDD